MQEEVKHYKVKSLKTQLRPNSVYYVKATSQSSVKTYITDQTGLPFPLVDLQGDGGSTGAVQTVTGTGVTGTPNNPVVNISTFKSPDLGNLIELSTNDGKLFVKPITSPDGSIDITSTASALEIQLSTSLQTQIQNALQSGDNISELNNDAGYITLADIPFSSVAATAWTPNHITATGNPYLIGTLVYYSGHIFQANFNNDSITPAIGGNLYWTDLGLGYLIDQEQTDWLAVSGSAFIKNKPINVSSFINDSGYLTSFTETDPVFSAWLSTNPLNPYLLVTTAASTYLPIPTGTVSQYVRGDGTLALLPVNSANNGLNTAFGNIAQLGGALLQDTTIDGGATTAYNLKLRNGDLLLDKGSGVGGVGGNLIFSNDRRIYWGGNSDNYISANSSTGVTLFYAPNSGRNEFYSSVRFTSYGAGTKTGTATYNLSVNSAGDIIETIIPVVPTSLSQLSEDETHRTVTDSEKTTWNNKQNALGYIPYPSSNPASFINSSALTPYLTISSASAIYQPLLGYIPYNSSNPAGYVTASIVSGYLTSAAASATYQPISTAITLKQVQRAAFLKI